MAAQACGTMQEVVVAQSLSLPWKDIAVNTGASASTLQDIKVPDGCGGFTYRDSGHPGSPVRNRFIYWRTWGDVLELEESSLDIILTGNRVRYRLQDTAIIGGVSISETHSHVIVLVATVASVHRLVFPHPCRRAHSEAFAVSDHISTSIFYDASLATATDARNKHMLNPGGSITAHLLSATSCVNADGEALFALATNSGSILLLRMPPVGITGVVVQTELSQSSVMQKLWSGLVPGAIRGHQQAPETAVSLTIQPFHGENYIFALCRDLHLRVWATKTRECELNVNLQQMLGDVSQSAPPSPTGHVIKPVQSSSAMPLMFCAYLSFPDRSQFLLLEPVVRNGRLSVQQHATLTQPAEDLIDFCMNSNHLITLWTDSNGESIARAALLEEGIPTGQWRSLLLQPPDTSEPHIPLNRDARDFFMDRIFRPHEFSHQDIVRALNVYRRSHDASQNLDAMLMTINLQEEVINAVRQEIWNQAMDFEMSEEAFEELQLKQWERFYSCCCQYREVGAKLQGVFCDSVTGLVCLIRKASLSYLRPCDQVERLYLCDQERLTPRILDDMKFAVKDVSAYAVCEDIHKICSILRLIESEMTPDKEAQFTVGLQGVESPKLLVESLVDSLFFLDVTIASEVGSQLDVRLQAIRHLVPCLDLLQQLLDVHEMHHGHSLMDESGADASQQVSCSHLFTSTEASAIIARTFEQVCQTRLAMLRNLVILQVLVLRLGEKRALGPAVCHSIEQELLPGYISLVRSYNVLHWASQALVAASPTSSLDSNMRRLASLELSDSGGFPPTRPASSILTVLESFIQGIGGTHARQQVALVTDRDPQATWSHDLMTFVHSLAALVWPLSDETVFPEFLTGSCQYLALQEYVRLLRPWCMWNEAAAMFFLGLSYLYFDEPHKARRCFINASEGIATENFLSQKLLQGSEGSHRQLTIVYYLKVIGQFEEYGMPDMVISLANEAICLADFDDPNLATLQSKVFKHELELGHNQEAFTAMMANPDPSRRTDCLRQLLVILTERSQIQELVEFPYKDLEQEVVAILESRARSVDLSTHNYYNLLYSFHVYRNNLRKAASVMYEQGLRAGQELSGCRGLLHQAQCYLVALNVLRLVHPDYTWIIKPALHTSQMSLSGRASGDSPVKHTVDGEEKQPCQVKKKVQIMDLEQLEKEYTLLDSRVHLIRKNPDTALASGPTPGADEMVGILVSHGLYDRAIQVCQAFGLKLHTVFGSLSLKCVNLARSSSYFMAGDNNETSEAWDWLKENDICSSASSKDSSAPDHAWKLLQRYLERYEERECQYHRCVSEKLLSQGFPLPAWLVNSYKVWCAPELLRVYLDYDLLQPAAELLMEYLEALTGVLQGREAPVFDLKGVIHHSPMSVWVPYTCADQLLCALRRHQEDRTHIQLHSQLQEKMSMYHNKLSDLSDVHSVFEH